MITAYAFPPDQPLCCVISSITGVMSTVLHRSVQSQSGVIDHATDAFVNGREAGVDKLENAAAVVLFCP